MGSMYRHFHVGKTFSTQSSKTARWKNTNPSCGTLHGVRFLVFEQILLNSANTKSHLLIE